MRKFPKVENAPYGSIPQDAKFSKIYDEVHNEEDEEEEMEYLMGEIVPM